MSDIRDMNYITETIDRTISGPYTGKRYGGMSNDVVFALLTVAYRFDGFEIVVNGIPAKWDRKTGSEYITGTVGRRVHEHVATIANALRRQPVSDATVSRTDPGNLEAQARELATMMVRAAPKTVSIHPDLAA
jgi:hypothetical protein